MWKQILFSFKLSKLISKYNSDSVAYYMHMKFFSYQNVTEFLNTNAKLSLSSQLSSTSNYSTGRYGSGTTGPNYLSVLKRDRSGSRDAAGGYGSGYGSGSDYGKGGYSSGTGERISQCE